MSAPMREGGTNPKDLVGAKKAPLSLVPSALVIGASEAMGNGAEKYGPFNWREYPVQIMTYVEAAQRHLAAFTDGQDLAEDTGIHHLKHVVAGLAIVLDSIALGIAVDNRPPKGPAADLLRVLDKTAKANEPLILGRPAPAVVTWDESHEHSLEDLKSASDAASAARLWAEEFRVSQEPWGTGDGPVFECRLAADDRRLIDFASGHGY